MRGRGHQIFADELARFAAGHADRRVAAVAERTAAPLRVAVLGRRGVGRGTVARALDRAASASEISVTIGSTTPGDVVVYVTAEVLKPEDTAAITAAERPVVAVLNKADLVGSLSGRAGRSPDGPVAAARMRCADLSSRVGVPMAPMIGLLAGAAADGLDEELWAALRTLATRPACLDGSFPEFLAADNPVPAAVRLRLLDTLDLFGVALGMAAARRGRTPAQLRALLRRVSGVDAVLAKIAAAGAEVRYRRVLDAVADLEALAVAEDRGAERISAFLCRDDTVIARMAAAWDMAEAMEAASGLDVDSRSDDPAAHLRRAVRWQRYGRESRGPASEVRRCCGADIARGSLRLWSQACGSPPGERS